MKFRRRSRESTRVGPARRRSINDTVAADDVLKEAAADDGSLHGATEQHSSTAGGAENDTVPVLSDENPLFRADTRGGKTQKMVRNTELNVACMYDTIVPGARGLGSTRAGYMCHALYSLQKRYSKLRVIEM